MQVNFRALRQLEDDESRSIRLIQTLLLRENRVLRNEVLDKVICVLGKWPDTPRDEILKELEEFQSQDNKTCCDNGVRGNLSGTSGVKLVGVEELAKTLGVTKNWIYQRTCKNAIPHVKAGQYCKFYVDEVLQFLDEEKEKNEKGKSLNGTRKHS